MNAAFQSDAQPQASTDLFLELGEKLADLWTVPSSSPPPLEVIKANSLFDDIAADERRRGRDLHDSLIIGSEQSDFDEVVRKVDSEVDKHNKNLTKDQRKAWAAFATTMLFIHAAKFDEQYEHVREYLDDFETALPAGFSLDQFLPCKIAQQFVIFGEARKRINTGSNPVLPSVDDLNKIIYEGINQSELTPSTAVPDEQESGSKWLTKTLANLKDHDKGDALNPLLLLIMFLIDSVVLLPPAYLRQDEGLADWLEKASTGISRLRPEVAKFHYFQSRIYEAQDEIAKALSKADDALQNAPSWNPNLIEEYRVHLRSLEQRKARDEITRADINEEVVKRVGEEMRKGLEDAKEEIRTSANETTVKLREEIRDALLRVVEILGVFLAVVAVAASTVGGFSGEFEWWQQILIMLVGFSAIIFLFYVLRWIVWRTGGEERINPAARSESDEP